MKLSKFKLLPTLALITIVTMSACVDLDVSNTNDPDSQRSLSTPADLVSLVQGGTSTAMQATVEVWGYHMGAFADQSTSTNNVLNFWDFAEEPRLRLNNRPTYATADAVYDSWSSYNSAIWSANQIIGIIETDGESIILDDGTDLTQQLLAGAYMLKGFSLGYLGMIYDQAFVIDRDTPTQGLTPVAYGDVIAAAVENIDNAIAAAEAAGSSFTWDIFPGGDAYSLSEFKAIANSYAAKFLANAPRTSAEASAHDWDAVLSYAQKGLGQSGAADGGALGDFTLNTVGPYVFFNNYADWNTYVLTFAANPVTDWSGYLPIDLKQIHLLDPSYPATYPAGNDTLPPGNSTDPRIDYYFYTLNWGYLNPTRNKSIFSNYFHLRMWGSNDWGRDGLPIPLMNSSEVQYILAEANLWKGNKGNAANFLNASPYGTGVTDITPDLPSVQDGNMTSDGMSGGNTILSSASTAEFVRALHLEYSVELDIMGGIGLQWFFMRKHDLLQKGTPLHLPMPGAELEIIGADYYTYGGVDATDSGTASGSSNWKTFDQSNGLKVNPAAKVSGAFKRVPPTISLEEVKANSNVSVKNQ